MTSLADAGLEREFAEKLARRRRALLAKDGNLWGSEYSQTAVAKRLHVDSPLLWRWENCEGYPSSWAMWQQWARAVGMSLHLELEG